MSQETELYEKLLKRVNKFLTVSGSYFDDRDIIRNTVERFSNRWFYCFNMLWLFGHIIGEFAWLAVEYKTASMVKLTYLIPCVTLSALGCAKSYFLIKHGDRVTDLIRSIKNLQLVSARKELRDETENELNKRNAILTAFINTNVLIYTSGFSLFVVGPLVLSWVWYRSSGKLVMQLPFLAKFPFDETDIRYWPIAFVHQVWSGFVAVSAVHGSDSFYSLSCTFLQIQFKILQYDIERMIPEDIGSNSVEIYEEFRERFVPIIKRHNELIRCVNLIESIYSKSTLLNVGVSSIVMCLSAFNIMTIDEFMLKTPFMAFLIMWLLQVFSLCYYSDLLIESSTEMSDAVYNSPWYQANAQIMKDLLFVLTRAQRPCKLTAMGFTDLNLKVFSKIASTSWSYFALLQSMYNK